MDLLVIRDAQLTQLPAEWFQTMDLIVLKMGRLYNREINLETEVQIEGDSKHECSVLSGFFHGALSNSYSLWYNLVKCRYLSFGMEVNQKFSFCRNKPARSPTSALSGRQAQVPKVMWQLASQTYR